MRWRATVVVAALTLVGCTGVGSPEPRSDPIASTVRTSTPSPARSESTPSDSLLPTAPARVRFDRDSAMATVRHLAGRIGPREAASARFRRAADWIAQRLTALGYDVTRQPVRVPAGVSWGDPVAAGRTWNVVGTPPDLRSGQAYAIVGAHLDTVPQAPGAEDNASGVAVLLDLARMASRSAPPHPVVFIAFGGEEPRGDGDARHHFGSRAYVDRMTGRQRAALRGMISLDRVGVGHVVPVCSGGQGSPTLRRSLLRTAARIGVPTEPCEDRASDHWSFEKAGLPAARIGSTPYAEYHSPADLPGVVRPAQLARVARLLSAWLARSRP